MKYTPQEHHERGIAAVLSHACMGLLLDRGLGKTGIMLAAFKILKAKRMVRSMLVITGLRPAYEVWPVEREKFEDFHGLTLRVLHGDDKDKPGQADIEVINPEGLPWLFAQFGRGDRLPWDVLCVDESTRFKHTQTQRFKWLKPKLDQFSRRYILTGTPSPNGLMDLFGQIFILDLGNSLGQFITRYRNDYFDSDVWKHKWTPRSDSEEKIYRRIAPLTLRMEAKDYIKMPPLVGALTGADPLVTWVELPPDARRAYDQMEALMIAELSSGTIMAANAAAVSGKCRQLANGGAYGLEDLPDTWNTLDSGKRRVHDLHYAKVDAVEEIIEEFSGVPALVAYEFDHDRLRLQKRFPDAPHIGGGVPTKRFSEIIREWNAGNLQVLLAQPQSVAHGLNLQGTRANVVWHSIPWDLELYDQFNSRPHRYGQKYPVFVHHVAAKNTIDQVIIASLKRKDTSQRALLAALKQYGIRR